MLMQSESKNFSHVQNFPLNIIWNGWKFMKLTTHENFALYDSFHNNGNKNDTISRWDEDLENLLAYSHSVTWKWR